MAFIKVKMRASAPKALKDIPFAPADKPGLITTNGSWRVEKPVCDKSKCNGCFLCYLYCPDGVIAKDGDSVRIDYDFCKGCGICRTICRKGAISMESEK